MFEIDKDFIINLRKKLKLSQLVFASVLSVNLLTIKNWEKGITTPSLTVKKLLYLLNKKPQLIKYLYRRI